MAQAVVRYRRERVLIWGKTYPQLSKKYQETVCTGACIVRTGEPIRIFPVPLRYLAQQHRFELYDILEAPIAKAPTDQRPESYKIDARSIKKIGKATTKRGWETRREIVFRHDDWQYDCHADLVSRQESDGASMGIVRVRRVTAVDLEERHAGERKAHEDRLAEFSVQRELFGQHAQKNLAFFPYKFRVEWECESEACPGHNAVVIDWGLAQLARRDGVKVAMARLRELTDVKKHDLRFFMGNMWRLRETFMIVGLWYPLRRDIQQRTIFGG